MKKIILSIAVVLVLIVGMVTLTGCTLQIETTDNSVSASVDGDTTEKVDGIIDWIKERLSRIFSTSDSGSSNSSTASKA